MKYLTLRKFGENWKKISSFRSKNVSNACFEQSRYPRNKARKFGWKTRGSVNTAMSSFFEFLIKAILCMRVKNFTTVHLIARGLQLTLFHYGVNIAAMQKGSTPSLTPNPRKSFWNKNGSVFKKNPLQKENNPKSNQLSNVMKINLKRYRGCNSRGGKELKLKIARQKRSSPNWIGVVYQQQVDGIEPPLLARVQKTFPPSSLVGGKYIRIQVCRGRSTRDPIHTPPEFPTIKTSTPLLLQQLDFSKVIDKLARGKIDSLERERCNERGI